MLRALSWPVSEKGLLLRRKGDACPLIGPRKKWAVGTKDSKKSSHASFPIAPAQVLGRPPLLFGESLVTFLSQFMWHYESFETRTVSERWPGHWQRFCKLLWSKMKCVFGPPVNVHKGGISRPGRDHFQSSTWEWRIMARKNSFSYFNPLFSGDNKRFLGVARKRKASDWKWPPS